MRELFLTCIFGGRRFVATGEVGNCTRTKFARKMNLQEQI